MQTFLDASANEEGDLFDYIAQPEGKIGAKKMAKLEEKARKRADREVSAIRPPCLRLLPVTPLPVTPPAIYWCICIFIHLKISNDFHVWCKQFSFWLRLITLASCNMMRFLLQAMERERAEQKEREALLEEERKKEEARLLRLEAKKVCRSVLFSDREISPLEV